MSPSGRSRDRRDRPGHNHRLVAKRVPGASAMAQAVNDYLSAIAAEGFSPYTVAYRTRSLGVLVVWLAERGISSPGEVTKPVLERYQRSLFHHRKADGNPLSFRTQAAYLVPVKALFKWLARTNRILYNPASELVMPRVERRLPRTVLSIAEAETVLAQADLGEPIGVRDRAIMEVAYSTGLRRSELRALQLVDVDHDRGWVAVRQGKGAKDRAVPIGERALAWVDRYLIDVRPRLVVPPDDGVLFLTLDGNDLTPDYLSDKIGRYIRAGDRQAGVVSHVPPHHGHPDARGRRRHPPHPRDPRPRPALHHRDLHPRQPRRPQTRPHRVSPRRSQPPTPPGRPGGN